MHEELELKLDLRCNIKTCLSINAFSVNVLLFSSGLFAKAVQCSDEQIRCHWCLCMCKTTWLCCWLSWLGQKHQILSVAFDISPTPLSCIQWKALNDVWWTVQTMLELMLGQLFKSCLDLDICIFLDSFLSTANHDNSTIWLDYLNCVVLYSVSSLRDRCCVHSAQRENKSSVGSVYSYCVAKSIWSIFFSGVI